MTRDEIMQTLETLASPSIKKVLLKHDIPEPLMGVKVEEMKKIAKKIKNGYELSLQLYDTGVYDAMYLAGLVAEPSKMTVADLQHWADTATCHSLREYTVAWVTAESPHCVAMAMQWIHSGNTDLASIGWNALSDYVAMTPDDKLDVPTLKDLLLHVGKVIHTAANRQKYTMNGFIIAVGVYVTPLSELARTIAEKVGKVTVYMGDTACKVPFGPEYIEKIITKSGVGKKRKSVRCL